MTCSKNQLPVSCIALLFACTAACATTFADELADGGHGTVAPVLYQPSMNVFRRHVVEPEEMFAFYGDVLGFEQLPTLGAVARFQTGASEFKLTRRVGARQYQEGGVRDATGLRLVSFFFPDEAALVARFEQHGYPVPEFQTLPGSDRRVALTLDPDGQPVELVVLGGASAEAYEQIEVGLTVADIEKSRAFYRDFVGLKELAPIEDPVFGTTRYSFRHGSTIISLRSFGADLPADTGSGGIQYVVSNVDRVDVLAKERAITIDQPLSAPADAALRTIWLDDPDGITNYFAETTWSRPATSAVSDPRGGPQAR